MPRLYANDRETTNVPDLYLRDIRRDALLSAQEERELAEAIAAGDSDARARMIRANLRLVVTIAREYLGRGLSMDDLIGEGNLGLIRATKEYDPRFGTRFSTYASYWIKQAIRHALTNTTATIRLPAHLVNLMAKWRRAERQLARELGHAPRPDQVADGMGLTGSQRTLVERAIRAGRLCRENGSGDAGSWSPDEESDGSEPPDVAVEAADERRDLLRRMEGLDDRERTVVSLRFGLEGHDPLTLKEVGRRLGVTREWVRKIEIRAVEKLDDRWPADASAKAAPGRSKPAGGRPTVRGSRTSPARTLQMA